MSAGISAKEVLGHQFVGKGERDGLNVLDGDLADGGRLNVLFVLLASNAPAQGVGEQNMPQPRLAAYLLDRPRGRLSPTTPARVPDTMRLGAKHPPMTRR